MYTTGQGTPKNVSITAILYCFIISFLECLCLGIYAYQGADKWRSRIWDLTSYLTCDACWAYYIGSCSHDPERLGRRFFYFKLADTIARYKNRNLKPRNRTDTIGRYKNRNLRPRNRIGRLKNRNSKRTDTIGRYKNRNLTSTDCIVRYNRKIESVSENR